MPNPKPNPHPNAHPRHHPHPIALTVTVTLTLTLALTPTGEPPSFDHAMAASQTAKLLIQRGADGRLRCASDPEMEGDRSGDRGDCEGDRISVLVESLVVVGRRLGVLNIEKYVAALDLADQVATARVRCRARATRGRRGDMKRNWPLSTKPTRWRRSRRSTTASAPTSARARSNPDPNTPTLTRTPEP